MKQSKLLPLEECQLYRGGRKGSPQVWGILLLLLLTTSAWLCLQDSLNLAEAFLPIPVHESPLVPSVRDQTACVGTLGCKCEGGRVLIESRLPDDHRNAYAYLFTYHGCSRHGD